MQGVLPTVGRGKAVLAASYNYKYRVGVVSSVMVGSHLRVLDERQPPILSARARLSTFETEHSRKLVD
jgi:hypothetical protein